MDRALLFLLFLFFPEREERKEEKRNRARWTSSFSITCQIQSKRSRNEDWPGRYSGTCQRPDGKTLSTFPFSFEEVLGSTVRCRYRCSLLLSSFSFKNRRKEEGWNTCEPGIETLAPSCGPNCLSLVLPSSSLPFASRRRKRKKEEKEARTLSRARSSVEQSSRQRLVPDSLVLDFLLHSSFFSLLFH